MIQGLFETHLSVRNLEVSAKFYEEVLGLELAYIEEQRRARFYWIGSPCQAMLGVWEVEPAELNRGHFAFQSSIDDIKRATKFLKDRGIQPRNFNNTGEDLLVIAWMPAISIYFPDPDGNSLEFLSMLPDEAKPELGLVPWEEWETMHGRTL